MNEVNKGTRIINYGIDLTIITIVSGIFSFLLSTINYYVIYFIVYLAYYLIFELSTGQTIGKIATNTIVMDMNNQKPSTGKIIYRTLLRLNPFDAYSYLFGQEQGGHDLISKTRLRNKSSITSLYYLHL